MIKEHGIHAIRPTLKTGAWAEIVNDKVRVSMQVVMPRDSAISNMKVWMLPMVRKFVSRNIIDVYFKTQEAFLGEGILVATSRWQESQIKNVGVGPAMCEHWNENLDNVRAHTKNIIKTVGRYRPLRRYADYLQLPRQTLVCDPLPGGRRRRGVAPEASKPTEMSNAQVSTEVMSQVSTQVSNSRVSTFR